jgi:hypothetical protein
MTLLWTPSTTLRNSRFLQILSSSCARKTRTRTRTRTTATPPRSRHRRILDNNNDNDNKQVVSALFLVVLDCVDYCKASVTLTDSSHRLLFHNDVLQGPFLGHGGPQRPNRHPETSRAVPRHCQILCESRLFVRPYVCSF